MNAINTLKSRLQEIEDLKAAISLLTWDQYTYLPPRGATARARQMATLGNLLHQKQTDPALGKALEAAEKQGFAPDSDEAALLHITRRDFERELKIPANLNTRIYEHTSRAYETWTKARPANDFQAVQPLLEKTLELSREKSALFKGYAHVADPLIEDSDYGMTVAKIRPLFSALRAELVPLVQAITSQAPADDACLKQRFDSQKQLAFGAEAARVIGYDFERGRQDLTHHPFMIKFSLDDVRITTRVKDDDFSEAFFSILHEAGHALYEQGVNASFEATPLAGGTSAGIHESQSRLWENLVGRSRPFWEYFYPQAQAAFPEQLTKVPLDAFYRAINKVQKSLIRTDADEVTYNLHVMIRFDLEVTMLEGKLAVKDLPEAWNARYESDLGIRPPADKDGVLQDVHWYCALIGGTFQGYTIGNVYAAQCFDAALKAHPEIPKEMTQGRFQTLRQWLRQNVHQYGRKFDTDELVVSSTGRELSIEPYIAYLKKKFGTLYALPSPANRV